MYSIGNKMADTPEYLHFLVFENIFEEYGNVEEVEIGISVKVLRIPIV